MPRIKLNVRQLSIPDKVQRGRQIITAMTNNANFSNPHPPLSDVTAALANLEQNYALLQAAKADVKAKAATQDDADTKVNQILAQLAAYVESIAGTDEKIITSAGLTTKVSRSTPTFLSPPQGLSATAGDHEGVIDLSWKKVANARSYTIQMSPDPPTAESWTQAAIATASTRTIENLTSGKGSGFASPPSALWAKAAGASRRQKSRLSAAV